MCCGAGRAALRGQVAASAGTAPRREVGRHSLLTGATVRYVGGDRIRVRGTATGTVYDFRAGGKMSVSHADVAGLVRSGLFLRR